VSTVPVGLPEVRHRQTDRQTDRQTLGLYWVNTALCITSHGKTSNHYTMNMNSWLC